MASKAIVGTLLSTNVTSLSYMQRLVILWNIRPGGSFSRFGGRSYPGAWSLRYSPALTCQPGNFRP